MSPIPTKSSLFLFFILSIMSCGNDSEQMASGIPEYKFIHDSYFDESPENPYTMKWEGIVSGKSIKVSVSKKQYPFDVSDVHANWLERKSVRLSKFLVAIDDEVISPPIDSEVYKDAFKKEFRLINLGLKLITNNWDGHLRFKSCSVAVSKDGKALMFIGYCGSESSQENYTFWLHFEKGKPAKRWSSKGKMHSIRGQVYPGAREGPPPWKTPKPLDLPKNLVRDYVFVTP